MNTEINPALLSQLVRTSKARLDYLVVVTTRLQVFPALSLVLGLPDGRHLFYGEESLALAAYEPEKGLVVMVENTLPVCLELLPEPVQLAAAEDQGALAIPGHVAEWAYRRHKHPP